MIKKYIFSFLLLLGFLNFIGTPLAHADEKGMNLFNYLGKDINDMEGGRDFGERQIVFQVEGYEKQVTTVGKLLTAAREQLTREQTRIFTLPLAVAYLQGLTQVEATVTGDRLSNLHYSLMSSDNTGLANLGLNYSGDQAGKELLLKVAAKVFTEMKQKSVTLEQEKNKDKIGR